MIAKNYVVATIINILEKKTFLIQGNRAPSLKIVHFLLDFNKLYGQEEEGILKCILCTNCKESYETIVKEKMIVQTTLLEVEFDGIQQSPFVVLCTPHHHLHLWHPKNTKCHFTIVAYSICHSVSFQAQSCFAFRIGTLI